MNKPFLRIGATVLLLSAWLPISAQLSNPLETDPSVWNSKEIVLVWGEANFDNDAGVKQAIYGVDFIKLTAIVRHD